jgi:hypothetical protein
VEESLATIVVQTDVADDRGTFASRTLQTQAVLDGEMPG